MASQGYDQIDRIKNVVDGHAAYKVIILIVLILLLWNFIKNNLMKCDKQGMTNTSFTGIDTRVYDARDKLPKDIIFVSGIHDYYPPFTKVAMGKDGAPYMPIHNSRMGYVEQMRKFR